MTLVAIDWLSISINLLLVIFVIVCLLMTLLILMQRPKQEGLGAAFGGGVTDQVFGARTTNVLQRGTVYLGTLFFLLALVLAILISHQNKDSGLLQKDKPAAEEAEATPADEDTTDAGGEPEPGDLPSSLVDELPDDETGTDAPTGTTEEATETSDSPDSDESTEAAGDETPRPEGQSEEQLEGQLEGQPESEEAPKEQP